MQRLIRKTGLLALALALSPLSWASSATDQDSLAAYLPSDSLLYISFPDLTATKTEVKQTAFYKIAHDEEVQAFFAPIKKMLMEQASSTAGDQFQTIQNTLQNVDVKNLSIAITHVDPSKIQESQEGLGLIVDLTVGGGAEMRNGFLAALETLIGDMLKQHDKEAQSGSEKIGGTDVKTFGNDKGKLYRVDLTDSRSLLSLSKDALTKVLENRKSQQGGLSKNADYSKSVSKSYVQGDEMDLFVNTAEIGRIATQMGGAEAKGILDFLNPGSVAMGIKFDQAIIRTSTFLTRTENGPKVFSLFSGKQISPDVLSSVPKDAIFAQVAAVDIEKLYPMIKEMAEAADPGSSKEMDTHLEELKKATGVDVKAELLDQLTGEFLTYAMMPKGMLPIPGVVIQLGIKDSAKVKKAVNTLLGLAGSDVEVKGVSYKDNTLYTLSPAADGMTMPVQPAYAFTDDRMMLAIDVQDLKMALSRNDKTNSLLDNAQFKTARANANLPGSFSGMTFVDMEKLAAIIYNSAMQGLQMLAMSPMADQIPFDLALLPSANAITQHLAPSLSFLTVDDQGLSMHSASSIGDEVMLTLGGAAVAGAGFAAAQRSMSRSYEENVVPEAPVASASLAVGSKAPDFELTAADGNKVKLSSLQGNVVVLDFWATWCGPCKQAMPGIQHLHEKYADKKVKIFGVNVWENSDPKAYMKEQNYTYGLLLNADEVAGDYHVEAIPAFYVIGKDGNILYSGVGATEDGEATLDAVIAKALEGK